MQHRCKELDEMLAKLASLGFRLEYRKNGVTIYPVDKSIPPYTAHFGERAFHPVRRWAKNNCGIILN